MSAADEVTKELLQQFRSEGKLISANGTIDDETAEALLKTPPIKDLSVNGEGAFGALVGRSAAPPLQAYSSMDIETVPIAEIISRIETECARFHPNLAASMKLASEQMHRSLLQLFEDFIRDKLVDLVFKKMQNSQSYTKNSTDKAQEQKVLMPGFSGVGSGINAVSSRRPYDKGFEKRDRSLSAFVLPEQLRDALRDDIKLVVENELRRCIGSIGSDVDKIFNTIHEAKGRMSRIEEDILQRQVEGRMQAEQLVLSEEQIKSLSAEIKVLEDHQQSKDNQMDILRDQVLRRNQVLDESRIKFRKEILRYKQRLFELETELEASSGNTRGKRRTSSAILGDISSLGSHTEDETGMGEELTAAAESAVKECTARLEEEHRRKEVQLQREKKAIQTEMALRLAERDREIIALREKNRIQ